MENYIEILKEKIASADMVLVGIGEEFGYSEKKIFESNEYHEMFSKIKEENEWIYPYFYAKIEEKEFDNKAYNILSDLLKDKNYFIVSLRTDDIIYKNDINLSKDRIVSPCGGVRKLQCEENCNNKIYDIPEDLIKELEESFRENNGGEGVSVRKCPDCGKKLVFNKMGTLQYCETDYLPNWEKYTKWLQGTLNRNLCIVELGVGMKYPSVIRWPFEKMAFFNQKATIFRVHSKLYQLTEEIKEKGYAVAQKPVEFLVNSFE